MINTFLQVDSTEQPAETEPCHKEDPMSEYIFNLMPLKKRNGFYNVAGENSKNFKVLINVVQLLFYRQPTTNSLSSEELL